MSAVRYFSFGIVIDDIVFHDGSTRMGKLGGGGPQTAFGLRLWLDSASRIGLVAGVGSDLSEEMLFWLQKVGIDPAGLQQKNSVTPRAWQILEQDGRRTQIWRVPEKILASQLARSIDRIPSSYMGAKGVHLGIHPNDSHQEFITELHHYAEIVSVEPFKPADQPFDQDLLHSLLSSADIFSPNLHEAISLVGDGDPIAVLKRLFDHGGNILALRLGKEGSIIAERGSTKAYHIPSVPVDVIDPLGAGNAYCGGFLAGYGETGNLIQAGLFGSVSASFLIEQIGLPDINEMLVNRASERISRISNGVAVIDF